jgi:predicted GNAT family acetyltransferase
MTDTLPEIRHNVAARRFETTVDDLLARADYQLAGSVMRLYHTEVPQALEGRGIAAALVKAALAHARTAELTVEPACGYVRAWMKRHPESHDLLADGVRL